MSTPTMSSPQDIPMDAKVVSVPSNGGGQVAVDMKSSTLPDMYLQWDNLTVSVDIAKGPGGTGKKERLAILKDVSGSVKSGQVLAILGPSGCGKTTLVNQLSARMWTGHVEGRVLLNGQPRPKNWSGLTGFVEQDDVMYAELTVFETLQFAGKLRLPRGTPQSVIDARADELLDLLGLSNAKSTLVGNSIKKGISGGQRKRLAVACELFDRPRVLFLDECTSGLDATSASLLIEALMKMAKAENSIVILTIHQPRSSIFMNFDLVNILAKGDDVFFGTPAQALEYWQQLNLPLPAGENPADWFLDTVTISGLTEAEKNRQEAQLKEYCDLWTKNRPPNPVNTLPPVTIERGTSPGKERPNWFEQFAALLKRNWIMFRRDRGGLISAFVQTIVIALFLGLVFFGMTDGAGALLLRLLAFFFVTFVTLVVNCFPTVQTFALERKVLVRERSSNSYAPSAFYLAKLVLLFPIVTLSNIIIVSISYWMMGLIPDVTRFFLYMVSVVILAWLSQALGLAIGSIFESPQTGAGVAQILVLVFIVFGGLFSGFMPFWINWIQWISPANWAFRALAQLCLSGLKFRCQTVGPFGSTFCLVTGDDALEMFAVNYPAPWICILVELGFLIAYHFIALVGLQFTTKKKSIMV